jgi:YVTN family beta-propeller protein
MRRIALLYLVCVSGLSLVVLLPRCAGEIWQAPRAEDAIIGRVAANRFITPTGQALTPAGWQIELPGMRPQALALSPDGVLLAVAGKKDALILLDAASGQIVQKVPLSFIEIKLKPETKTAVTNAATTNALAATQSETKTNAGPVTISVTNTAEMSFTGLIFSHRGDRIYLSNTKGNVWSFPVGEFHLVGRPTILPIPHADAPKQEHEIPSGLALSADDQRLYVTANLGNRLHEIDVRTAKTLRTWKTGAVPFDVVLVRDKAYVCNLGGRRPVKGDLAAAAGKGKTVKVDPLRYIADEGSVTVIDLTAAKVTCEILVDLHPSALAVSPNGKYVVVANTGSDTLHVLDTGTDQIVEKIWARQEPGDLFGAQPNALAFAPDGKRLYVCNGTQNAVAVVQFEPQNNASKVIGLIPAGWFPGAIQFDPFRKSLCIANIKGAALPKTFKPGEKSKLNIDDYPGSLSLVSLPTRKLLASMTRLALDNMRYPKLAEAQLPPRSGEPPRPVPERAGEPSVFKHVIYIIKENRTYDQILGDMPEGNGDTNLCAFGEQYTPNQHKLAREFVLLDNTYCSGIHSADGHQWTDSGLANEYIERQLTSGSPRSYPSGKEQDGLDALAWASSGFIWDNAMAHGKTFRNYGEWMISDVKWKDRKRKDKIHWTNFWENFCSNSCALELRSKPGIESLRKYCCTNTVGWDLRVPDVMRAAEFINELRQFETNGAFPNFVLLFLPNDHTGGTDSKLPKPGSEIADNDLALGQVVEALSHSRFWPETCLFAIEDDPAAGWDHVSGFRTTCYVASPYTKRRQTIHTQYNQISVVRTIELILGLPPMNQLDATASSMADCFTDTPDVIPFTSVPNRVALDDMNPEPKKIADRALRQDALASARLPLNEPDRCPEDLLNRILWRAMKGPANPYPEWAVKAVDDKD